MSNPQQIKIIHILKSNINLSDDEYRVILKGMFKVDSSKDLSYLQANKLINHLKTLEFKNKITKTQLSKISYLAKEVYEDPEKGLRGTIKRNLGRTKKVSSLTRKEASIIIMILENIKKWKEGKKQWNN